jgi:hypothetical protein
MVDWIRNAAWLAVFLGLAVFAIPWFAWGDSTIVAGLPAWLWYHVAWLGLTTAVFYAFTQRGWDEIVGVRSR